jgi:hypothetical protein
LAPSSEIVFVFFPKSSEIVFIYITLAKSSEIVFIFITSAMVDGTWKAFGHWMRFRQASSAGNVLVNTNIFYLA